MKKINISVKGMHCASCEMLIEDALEEQAGVDNIKTSFKEGSVKVEYDEKKINQKDIETLITNEGYKVE